MRQTYVVVVVVIIHSTKLKTFHKMCPNLMAEKMLALTMTGQYTSSFFKQPTRATSPSKYVLYLTFPPQNEAKFIP
jgi:hypothetical protein